MAKRNLGSVVGPKGDKGVKGDPGPQGVIGPAGPGATVQGGTVTMTPSGSPATVTNVGTAQDAVLDFTLPFGPKGDAATVTLGKVTRVPYRSEARVENVGDEANAIFDFYLPEGPSGPGTGDMLRSSYDADDDGVVDNAARLGGKEPDYYAPAAQGLLDGTPLGERAQVQGLANLCTQYAAHVQGSGVAAADPGLLLKAKNFNDPLITVDTEWEVSAGYIETLFPKLAVGQSVALLIVYSNSSDRMRNENWMLGTIGAVDIQAHTIQLAQALNLEENFKVSKVYAIDVPPETASQGLSHAEGCLTFACGNAAHAQGYETYALNRGSHAEGGTSIAIGLYAHAEGNVTVASGSYSHAEGGSTKASGERAHAEGAGTVASGLYTHAEGCYTTAPLRGSHAEGYYTIASGTGAHAEGVAAVVETVNRILKIASCAGTVITIDTAWTHSSSYIETLFTQIQPDQAIQIWGEQSGYLPGYTNYKVVSADAAAHTITLSAALPENYTALWAIAVDAVSGIGASGAHAEGFKTLVTKAGAHAEGCLTQALGLYSHAEGCGSIATGQRAHAECSYTKATGNYSHAEGGNTVASGNYSHAEGNYTTASSDNAHAEGKSSIAPIRGSHAEGYYTIASGTGAHAEGVAAVVETVNRILKIASYAGMVITIDTAWTYSSSYIETLFTKIQPNQAIQIWGEQSGYLPGYTNYKVVSADAAAHTITLSAALPENYTALWAIAVDAVSSNGTEGAHAEGLQTLVTKKGAHAEGCLTQALGAFSHAEGCGSIAAGQRTHAECSYTKATGNYSHAEGGSTTASGSYSHAEGYTAKANGDYGDHAEGQSTIASGGHGAHAEGYNTAAKGQCCHAEGGNTVASGNYSHAEGNGPTANGESSHAEGGSTMASGRCSHAEGYTAKANGDYGDHAEGQSTIANGGHGAHAEGYKTAASGESSHAEGDSTMASGSNSHAEGIYTIANASAAHAEGNGNLAVNGVLTVSSYEGAVLTIDSTWIGSVKYLDDLFAQIRPKQTAYVVGTLPETSKTQSYAVAAADATAYTVTLDGQIPENSTIYYLYLPQAADSAGVTKPSYAHSEGFRSLASGSFSHAEGVNAKAIGKRSHAEGSYTIASGEGSHAEGGSTHAGGDYTHAEGNLCKAYYLCSHAEGLASIAHEQSAHAEGQFSVAYGWVAHAEGMHTAAMGETAHAEGENTMAGGHALKIASYTGTVVTIDPTWAGSRTYIDKVFENIKAKNRVFLTGMSRGSEEYCCQALQVVAIDTQTKTITLEGEISNDFYLEYVFITNTSSVCTHAEGQDTIAIGECAHAEGRNTVAGSYQHVSGRFNSLMDSPTDQKSTTGSLFMIGKGTDDKTRANAFRVSTDGHVYGCYSYASSGADYAELFEWLDGNPDKQDRRGLFVTLDGEKIRLANADDDYILGVISGNPVVLGNQYADQWQGMYIKDVFGTTVWEEYTEDAFTDENGIEHPAVSGKREKLNPDYKPDGNYVPRSERPEWGTVGMFGQLTVIDDGSCIVNQYCYASSNGTATASDKGYRVIARLDDTHIRIIFR